MAVHMVVMAKLKLLTRGAGHSNWKLLVALLCPFALKVPFATRLPSSWADAALAVRLFLFRLNRIVFDDGTTRQRNGRWGRTLRLIHMRAVDAADEGRHRMVHVNEEMLNAVSMLAL